MIRQVICRYASVFCTLSFTVCCCRGLPISLEKEGLLDESCHNPTSHKATTIKILTRRARLVYDTPDSFRDENRYLERVFYKNNYNDDFNRRNISRPTEADATNRNPTPVTTVTIPYIKGTSETLSRILQPCNIRVAHKPTTTLRHSLTNVKDKDEPNNRLGAVYKFNPPTAWLPTLVRQAETLTRD